MRFFGSRWAGLVRALRRDDKNAIPDAGANDEDAGGSSPDAAGSKDDEELEPNPAPATERVTDALKKAVEKAASPIEGRIIAREIAPDKPTNPAEKAFQFVEHMVIAPLYSGQDAIGFNQIARLMVVWGLIVGGPLLLLGLSLSREFTAGESWRLRDYGVMDQAQVARNIADGRGFVTDVMDPYVLAVTGRMPDTPAIHKRPIYPIILGVFFKIFGASDATVIGVSCVFWLIAVWLTYAMIIKWGDRRVAGLALAFMAVNLTFITAATDGLDLCFKVALMTGFLWMLGHVAMTSPPEEGVVEDSDIPKLSTPFLFFLGALAGVMVLTSYAMLIVVLPPILAVLVFQKRARWIGAVGLFVGFTLLVAPYLVWVSMKTGNPLFNIATGTLLSDVQGGWLRDEYLRMTYFGETEGGRSLWKLIVNQFPGILRKARKNSDNVMVAFINCCGLAGGVLFAAHALGEALTKRSRRNFYLPLYISIAIYCVLAAFTAGPTRELTIFVPLVVLGAAQLVGDVLDRPKEHPAWQMEWSGPALRWGLCLTLVFVATLPFLGGFATTSQARYKLPTLDFLDAQLIKRKVDREIIVCDLPEMTSWYVKQPCVRAPFRDVDLDKVLDVARQNQQDIAGFFLLRDGDPASRIPFCSWLAYSYVPDGVFRNTKAVKGSRRGMIYRLAAGRLPEDEKEEGQQDKGVGAVVLLDIMDAISKDDRVTAFRKAVESFNKGDFARSGEALSYAVKQKEFLRAQILFIQLQTTLEGYEFAAERAQWVADNLAPDHGQVRSLLAMLYARLGRYPEALNEFRRAQALSAPVDTYTLAKTLASLGRRKQAAQLCKSLLQRMSQQPQPYPKPLQELIFLCFQVGLHDDVLDLGRQIIDQFPDDVLLQQQIGRLMTESALESGRAAETINLVREMYAKWPQWREGRKRLADLCAETGQYQEAINLYREWAHTREEKQELYALLAAVYAKNDNGEQLEKACLDGLRKSPWDVRLLLLLSKHYAEEGVKLEEAEKHARNAARIMPGTIESDDTLAWVLFKAGKLDEAAEILAKQETVLWRNPEAAYHYAVIHDARGDKEKAGRFVKMAIEAARKTPAWLPQAKELATKLGVKAEPLPVEEQQ